mmetsp:Transcript_45890/g.115067  ORF Transcript_45890/g.115067 Transcript_45890/m.115067 type:complete len:229 (-) Transcript_45890:295-981(-)
MSSAISHDSATTLLGSLANFSSRGVAAPSSMAPMASAASCRTIWFSSRFSSDVVREGMAALLAHCPSTNATSCLSTALDVSSSSTRESPRTASSVPLSRSANRLPYRSNRRTLGSISLLTCWSTDRLGSAGGAGSMLTCLLSAPSCSLTSPAASFFLAHLIRSSASWQVCARGSQSLFSNSCSTRSASSALIAPSASAASCLTMLSSSSLRVLISTGTALASSFCPRA